MSQVTFFQQKTAWNVWIYIFFEASNCLLIEEKLKDKKKNKAFKNGEKLECMSNEEQSICQSLELKPIAFVLIKETILAELSKSIDL